MKNFIFDQLFTFKRLRGKIERNEIRPAGYVLPSLFILLGTIAGFILMATDATELLLQKYRLVQDVIAAVVALLSLHIGFRQIKQPFSWKKAGLALYAIGWRMGLIGAVVFTAGLIGGSIIAGTPIDHPATFVGTYELMSVEATLAGLVAIMIPTSIAYLFGNDKRD